MSRKLVSLLIILILLLLGNWIIPVSGENTIVLGTNDYNEKENWAVIISGGMNEPISETFRTTARHAYNTLKKIGYDDDHIYFLQDSPTYGDGVDGSTNKSTFQYAITNWLKNHSDENDNCLIYFVDHGGKQSILSMEYGIFVWNYKEDKYEFITPTEINEWIEQVTCNICTIVIDTCVSGSFIKFLSGNNRIIITSCYQFRSSYLIKVNETTLSLVFSYHFFNKLAENVSYGQAWEYTDEQILNHKLEDIPEIKPLRKLFIIKLFFFLKMSYQSPQIDDNGDGKGHGRTFFPDILPIEGDGYLALETYPS